jgi:hypothetical protein
MRRETKKQKTHADQGLDPFRAWAWTYLTPLLAVVGVFVLTVFDPFVSHASK